MRRLRPADTSGTSPWLFYGQPREQAVPNGIDIVNVQQIELTSPEPEALQALRPHADAQLVTVFGAPHFFSDARFIDALRALFPDACLLGCSTAGEISRQGVQEGGCIVTAVRFASARVTQAATRLGSMEDSFAAGSRIGEQLNSPGLKGVIVLAPGLAINGSALVEGIACRLRHGVPITGGLAADYGAFERTWTLQAGCASTDTVVAVGLHGEALGFCHGSFGGWKAFGPPRRVTACNGNLLQEIDGEPALKVYMRYLGDKQRDLPAAGLLFPFAMFDIATNEMGPVRTILGIDRATETLILAGAVDSGGYLKLMHADNEGLVDGAMEAAVAAHAMAGPGGGGLAILVSCLGRKLVMAKRVVEEVAAVANVFGSNTTLTGFYANGEISPLCAGGSARLHNQTMTVSWLVEREAARAGPP